MFKPILVGIGSVASGLLAIYLGSSLGNRYIACYRGRHHVLGQ